jgi:hypothetical protein
VFFFPANLCISGPTSFAPIIEMAMTVVEQSSGQYHVLVIIADGQVTRSVDTEHGRLSPQEQKTVDAIVKASTLPLSIVLVGVGDGPWDMMQEFDDNIPARAFDNFQVSFFFSYHDIEDCFFSSVWNHFSNMFALFLVCELHRDHVKEQRPVSEGDRVCAVCSHGDPSTVQSNDRA